MRQAPNTENCYLLRLFRTCCNIQLLNFMFRVHQIDWNKVTTRIIAEQKRTSGARGRVVPSFFLFSYVNIWWYLSLFLSPAYLSWIGEYSTQYSPQWIMRWHILKWVWALTKLWAYSFLRWFSRWKPPTTGYRFDDFHSIYSSNIQSLNRKVENKRKMTC